jgi:hypothetical protein
MVEKKYNEIRLLVHPLFDVFFQDGSPVSSEKEQLYKRKWDWSKFRFIYPTSFKKTETNDKISSYILKKEVAAQLKTTLGIYGKEVLDCKNKPNTLFLTIIISKDEFTSQEAYDLYVNKMKKFIIYGKRVLGDRFIASDFGEYNNKPFHKDINKNNKMYSLFDKHLKIKAFGEYSNDDTCIPRETNGLCENLKKIAKITTEKEILYNKSLDLYFYEHDKDGFRNRFLNIEERKRFFKKNNISRNSKNKTFNFKRTPKIK